MSLLSSLRKNKQESASDDSAFSSRAEEESKAVRARRKRSSPKQKETGAEPVDPVLPEKKRARRRLIGAIALVLAAVVGLPMILDSEPKPLADDIAIQIPSRDKPAPTGTSRPAAVTPPEKITAAATLDPKEEIVDPASDQAAVEDPPAALADSKSKLEEKKASEPAKAVVVGEPVAAKPVTKSEVKADSKPEARGEGKHEVKAEPKPVKRTEPKAEVKEAKARDMQEDAARAQALLDGKQPPKSGDKKQRYVIQVAALATKEKIDELQGKLKGAGIKSFTQKVATESGDRTRIRVGPFATKEEADKMRARIAKLGLNGSLVPLDS
jgi:DedD protein